MNLQSRTRRKALEALDIIERRLAHSERNSIALLKPMVCLRHFEN